MNNIALMRKKADITQAQLAVYLGWKTSRIGNYEAGIRSPDLTTCRDIIAAFNAMGVACTLDSVFPPSFKKV